MKCSHLILGMTVAAAALAGPAKADQLEDIIANKTLRCATFADVPPFAAPDSKTREMVGFDVDLCGAIARELGAGRLVETGTHAELIARDGAYAAMVRAQAGEA